MTKAIYATAIMLFFVGSTFAQNGSVGINNNGSSPNSKAMLDVSSTTKGFLPPRMTYSQKTAIASPPAGLMVWCSNCGPSGELQVYNGSIWTSLTAGAASGLPGAPTLVTATAGVLQALVSFTAPESDGGSPITLYTATSNPGNITGTLTQAGSGTITVTGLNYGTAYTFTVTATNATGTSEASAASNSVTPLAPFVCGSSSLTDPRDGKVYTTVQIDAQCWMAQNLNVGTMINSSTGGTNNDGQQTNNAAFEKYCYNNDDANCETYGGLYQWDEMMQYSVVEGSQGICPTGWHLPTHAEWTTLTTYLEGESVAGGKMKETGFTHWSDPNTGATNSSGFTALPGGYRSTDGWFFSLSLNGYWWSSSPNDASNAWSRFLKYFNATVNQDNYFKVNGFSVRCLKDN